MRLSKIAIASLAFGSAAWSFKRPVTVGARLAFTEGCPAKRTFHGVKADRSGRGERQCNPYLESNRIERHRAAEFVKPFLVILRAVLECMALCNGDAF